MTLHRFRIDLALDDNADLTDPSNPLLEEELARLKKTVERQAKSSFGMARGTRRRPMYPVTVEDATTVYLGGDETPGDHAR